MSEERSLETQLMEIAQASSLTKEAAKTLVDEFRAAVSLDDAFVEKSMAIVVTDETQTEIMAAARDLRLKLKAQRVEVENLRKRKKDHYLRAGQAIDGVANHVKGLIEPVEKHLKAQEDFATLLEEKRAVERREKAERLLAEQEEREAAEEALAEAKRIALMEAENERLKVEAEKREKEAARERAKVDKERAAEREEAEARLKEQADKRAEAQAKADRDRERDLAAYKNELADARVETARLAALVKCPECGHTFDGRENPGEDE